ncbi:MAG: PAS domain S-box protein [Tenuifilaceae bacterium]
MLYGKNWLSNKNVNDYIFSIALYLASAIVTSQFLLNSDLPYIIWFQSGFIVGIVLTRGIKGISGIIIGISIWFVYNIFDPIPIPYLNSNSTYLLILSDLITAWLTYIFLNNRIEKRSFIEKIYGLKKFLPAIIIISLSQAFIIFVINYFLNNSLETNLIKTFQIIWLSVLLPIAIITPIFLTTSKITLKNYFQKISVTWEFLLFIALLIAIFIFEYFKIFDKPYLFSFQLLIIPAIVLLSFRKSIETLAIALFFLGITSIFLVNNIGNSIIENQYYHTINTYYIILITTYISLIINSFISEYNSLSESIKKNYIVIEEEVQLQTKDYRDLTSKLFEEISQRGIIERELSLSRNLLTESQEVASIVSWEVQIENDEIHWSDSAPKVIGFDQENLPKKLSDFIKYIHPEDSEKFRELFDKVSKSSTNFETEIRQLMQDGTIRHFLIRGRSFEENGVIDRVVGLSFDITARKEAENQIFEKEQKYRALFESNIDSVSVINAEDKTFVDVNHAFEEKYGYLKSEIVGLPYSTITAEKEETYLAIENAYRKGSYRVVSRIHKKKNGEIFYAEGIFVKYVSLGKPMIFVISHDITQRKIAEKNLAERELQYRLFFESDLIGMAETSIQKNWINFNNKLCKILGYIPQELSKKTWEQITHPDDLAEELRLFNNVLVHKNNGYNIEKRFIKKDGSTVYCNVSVKAIINPNGNITHLVKLIEDISARKQAEKELVESRATLRRAQQIAHLGIFSWNLSVKYLTINDEIISILGWKKSEGPFTIDKFINQISPEKRLIVEKIIDDAKKGIVNTESIEIPILFRSKETKYIQINVGFNIKNSIDVSEIVVTIADINEVKRAELALQEANALKDQLFSVIAHDLRGPIGNINQMISLLADNIDVFDLDTRHEMFSSLKSSTSETYNLLENLLDWAKSQRQSAFKPKTIYIKSLIDETIALLSGMASVKEISIETEIENELSAFADPYMVNTILRNLISNAIKFSKKGDKIRINGLKEGGFIVLNFIDSGIGISDKDQEKIFNYQENYSTLGTNNEKGTGLGLKLIKRFVEKNNGNVSIDSKPGKGTKLTITLPSHQ